MNSILALEQKNALIKLGAFSNGVNVDFSTADKLNETSVKTRVRITSKRKQTAMNAKERLENDYASKIDKPLKKVSFLKRIGRR